MSSCHIIIEENKILRPQTYNIRVLWQCNVGKTCEGVCEDPSTQASKHCTAIPSFVCKIVIAKFFYDVASLNFAKEYTILSQRLHLVACAVVCWIGWGRGQLKRTEKYWTSVAAKSCTLTNKQIIMSAWLFWQPWRNYNGKPALNDCIWNTIWFSLVWMIGTMTQPTQNWKRNYWNRFGFAKVKGRAW